MGAVSVVQRIVPALCALVLDAQECHALAGIRSLGRSGVKVVAASHKPDAMGFFSRFCQRRLLAPSPAEQPETFASWLLDTLGAEHYDALLFFGEASANVVARHRDEVQSLTGCPLPSYEAFLTADRKDRVLRLARSIGVPVPLTRELASLDAAPDLARRLSFPVIVKGVYGSGGHEVRFVRERDDFLAAVQQIAALRPDPSQPLPVIQEYVPGRGYGLTALTSAGEPLAVFMHRRLAEHDVARGAALAHASPGAESVDDPELREAGLRLLAALRWDGVAMVEFRRSDIDDRYYLMEVNPRFAGSLDLAVAAGVDLPRLYVQLAAGLPVDPPPTARVGLRYRWLLSKNVTEAFENPLGYAQSVLSTLRPDTRSDLALTDPKPHYSHLRNAAWWVREHLAGRGTHAQPALASAPEASAPAPVAAPESEECSTPSRLG
jgi:predicted ATP-grasp superfamily ATP-dependent carboligase